jgi:hypothetical protein
MLKSGKAIVVNLCPFVIKLTYVTTNYTQPITLGVDAGSIHVGLSASTEKREVYAAEVKLRSKDIKKLMERRGAARSTRRSRLRHRPARFNNRTGSKKEGWLAPSLQHRLDSHIRIIDSVKSILPITKIIVEIAPFDTQKLSNPDISGEEYQNGQKKGFANAAAFVRFRDKNTCQQCKRKEHIQVHHIQHREDDGPDRPDNLVCLCEKCHRDYHDGKIVLKEFKTLNKKNAVSLRDAAAMSIVSEKIYERSVELNPDIVVWKTYGSYTSFYRKTHNIEKSHANDAFVIARNFHAERLENIYMGIQVRRHNRKIFKDKILKNGVRKRNQAEHLLFGFATNDRVKYKGRECFIHGRRTSGYFDLRDIDGSRVHNSASYKDIKRIRHEKDIIFKQVKRQKASADSSSDTEDVAVSSAQIL